MNDVHTLVTAANTSIDAKVTEVRSSSDSASASITLSTCILCYMTDSATPPERFKCDVAGCGKDYSRKSTLERRKEIRRKLALLDKLYYTADALILAT